MNIHSRLRRAWRTSKISVIAGGLVTLLILFAGFRLVQTLAADSGSLEPEAGTLSGVTVIGDAEASGSRAIQFAGPQVVKPATPVNVRAFTGGNDIAVLWNPAAGSSPVSYNIYRDGVKVGNVGPAQDNSNGVTTTRFYDKAISNGKTYSYQIEALDAAGTGSNLTAALAVTQPANPTPVPTITVNAAVPADVKSWLEGAIPLLKTWYPKFSARVAAPDYTPPSAYSLATIKDTPYYAYVDGTTIFISESAARSAMAQKNGYNFLLHESGHILQQRKAGTPTMVTEGMADWLKNEVYDDNVAPLPPADRTYENGYEHAAYFFDWIIKTYNKPDIVRTLNVAAFRGTYSDDIFKQATGKSVGQLWSQMTGRYVSSPGGLVHSPTGKCVDVYYGRYDNGTPLQMLGCKGNDPQKFIAAFYDSERLTLRVLGKCMDVLGYSKADGTSVNTWDCQPNAANQTWRYVNNTLIDSNSGKCLQPKGGSLAESAQLEIATCNGSAAQKWVLPPQ